MIPRATHLYCFFHRNGGHDNERVEWLLGILEQTHKEQQEYQRNQRRRHQGQGLLLRDRSTMDKISITNTSRSNNRPSTTAVINVTQGFEPIPLWQLTLQGYVEIGMGLPGFLPYMASLTRLTINQVSDSNFSMSELLETCTQLEHFYIELLWTVNLVGPWLPSRIPSNINNNGSSDGDSLRLSQLPPFPLKSLKLIHVQLPQPCLEMFLASTPRLRELKIVLRDHIPTDENDLKRLCQHLQSLPRLNLESFHFSVQAEAHHQTCDDYANMMAFCPRSTDWTVQGSHLSFDTSRLIVDNGNRITTLEVLGQTSFLHDLLCQLPHLLSVKATGSNIPYQYLNIYSS
ncbi:hypothetical protein BGX24_003954 [Mortierella sp. AD032]|nr:hypothetical protein BGX24_003954 [Mortierella sp. AD032]